MFCTGLVRSLPSEEYVATVDDESTGSITCLSCTQTTRDKVTLHRMCTGGLELKLWDQLPSSKVKKRSRLEHFSALIAVLPEYIFAFKDSRAWPCRVKPSFNSDASTSPSIRALCQVKTSATQAEAQAQEKGKF